jgi:hypothetical protein
LTPLTQKNYIHIFSELGEEVDELPYKRPSRRGAVGTTNPSKVAMNMFFTANASSSSKVQESPLEKKHAGVSSVGHAAKAATKRGSDKFSNHVSTRNLLASRRIIDTFNVGDVAGIQSIIEDTVTKDCDVCIFPLNQHIKGRETLVDLWESMHEAFPDGVFRASDTTINDRGELITRFVFSGARQFNIVLGENRATDEETEIGEITGPNTMINNRACPYTVKTSEVDDHGRPYSNSISDYDSNNSLMSQDNLIETASLIQGDANLLLNAAKSMESAKKALPKCRSPSLSKARVASIGVDYTTPLIRSADLLIDDALVEVYEGIMVMHTNESYQICKLDYHWRPN